MVLVDDPEIGIVDEGAGIDGTELLVEEDGRPGFC